MYFFGCRIRPVFRLWRDTPRTSPVLVSILSFPSSSLDQKMVRTLTAYRDFLQKQSSKTYCLLALSSLLSIVPSSLCRNCAHLALKHLPSREHSELWNGKSLVCLWPQGLQQRSLGLRRRQYHH